MGYTVRFEDTTSKETKIKYLTDGMLLREAMLGWLCGSQLYYLFIHLLLYYGFWLETINNLNLNCRFSGHKYYATYYYVAIYTFNEFVRL